MIGDLTTAELGSEVVAAHAPPVDLGLGDTVLATLNCWAYQQIRWIDDPRATPYGARFKESRRYLCTEEPGGELEVLRQEPRVAGAWIARLLTMELPWGAREVLFAHSSAPPYTKATFVAGRAPASPGEIAVPEHLARLAGCEVGDDIDYHSTDYALQVNVEGTLRLVGVFRPQEGFMRDMALGWLPPGYPFSWVTDIDQHRPRVLENLEPNAYVIELTPGTDHQAFWAWFVEYDYLDEEALLHLHDRYPAVQVWTAERVAATHEANVWSGTGGLAAIVALSMALVELAALTILLLSFLERRREIGILRAVGMSAADVTIVLALEVAAVSLVGLATGLAGAFALVRLWLGLRIRQATLLRCVGAIALLIPLACALPIALSRQATVLELLSGMRAIALVRQRIVGTDGRSRRPHVSG